MPDEIMNAEDLAATRRIAWKVTRWRCPAGVAQDIWPIVQKIAQFYLDATDAETSATPKPAPKRVAAKKAAKS